MMAVTDSAPSFFMVDTARSSSMTPSLMLRFSNDFIMKTLCPLTESSISSPISPSLNL